MKLLLINSVCGIGSTGRICTGIAEEYEQKGWEAKIAYGRKGYVPEASRKYAVRIGSAPEMYMHVLGTRLFDAHGLLSARSTRKFLKWADEFDPDMLWLHNIHGYYINYRLLFDWIKSRPGMQVKWTLHDCWTFTGHCSHFMYEGCERWKEGCHDCPNKREYPASLMCDRSRKNYEQKREAFCGVKDLTLITPSKWLADEVGKSFLSKYPVEVSYNTVNTQIFKPVKGDFRKEHGISDGDHMILAVAGVWNRKKGLDDLLSINARLRSDKENKCRMVIAGLTDDQASKINRDDPDIICIGHTDSAEELAEIYSAADVFINPTYEDNYPTVNLEAEACGTPVITYDTGGCRETVHNEESMVIEKGADNMIKAIHEFMEIRHQGAV